MRVRWLGFLQALFLLGALAAGIPALIDLGTFNGLDVLALVLFGVFLFLCYVEPKRR